MRLFFDTSAFMKRYIEEKGSSAVESLCREADDLAVSMILPVEAISTLKRLTAEKMISPAEYDKIREKLFNDLVDITIIPITTHTVKAAINVVEFSQCKTLDAIHIACAREWKPDMFVSSDNQQITAALEEGLKVKKV